MKKEFKAFIVVIIILLGFVLFKNYSVQKKFELENNQTEWDKNNTRDIQSDDKYLNKAKQATKINLPYFISEFKNNDKSGTDFFSKIKLTEDENTEHIWVWILSLNDNSSIGLLSNEPKYFKNLKYLDTISFDINKSEDLMIMKNDSILFGGFLKTESEKE